MSSANREYMNFSIGLFEVGDPCMCLMACCFPYWYYFLKFCGRIMSQRFAYVHSAFAASRSNLDQSSFIFNFFCLGSVPLRSIANYLLVATLIYRARWMIRSAYGIPGDTCSDLLVQCCCIPCSANQLYQTTKSYGNPTYNGGRQYNTGRYADAPSDGVCCRFLYALFCLPCSVGTALKHGTGMPFWMGCCCTNFCTARNIIRYQNRIAGNDEVDECVVPSILLIAFGAGLLFWPLLLCVVPVAVSSSMKLQAESISRETSSGRYLINSNYTIPPVVAEFIEPVQYHGSSVVQATFQQPSDYLAGQSYMDPVLPIATVVPSSNTVESAAELEMPVAYALRAHPGHPQI
jgi:Cys-rich protein (TIGR01571 family)